jgi:magnesium chelatase family protein
MVHTNNVMNKNAPNQRAFILPNLSAQEASLVKDAVVYPANSLLEVCAHLMDKTALNQYQPNAENFSVSYPDFNKVATSP